MTTLTGSIVKYPARSSFVWYSVTIILGGFLLASPLCLREGITRPISLLDGIFTATSAVCVTGLTVRNTGSDFSFFGQFVIMFLIELGGIGILTFTNFVTFQLMGGAGLRSKTAVSETLGVTGRSDFNRILWEVLLTSFIIQAIGFLILLFHHAQEEAPFAAAWKSLFHTVAAFCNAGFAIHDDNLMGYRGDWTVNVVIAVLIILGGLGFPVLNDVRRCRSWNLRRTWEKLQLHSKSILIGTVGLLVLGTVAILFLEWDDTLKRTSWHESLLISFFQSVTCRTAGFNTVDIAALTNATLFIMVLLMMVGAGPCSTAGGFKVSTMMVMIYRSLSTMRGFRLVKVFRRTVPETIVDRATTTALLFAAVATTALTLLLFVEQSTLISNIGGAQGTDVAGSHRQFLPALFEVISALGTVGLSTGLTPKLSACGKIIIIVAMFIGRLGPISIVIALSRGEQRQPVEHPKEELLIG